MDAIIHVAGDTSFWKKKFERQRCLNVDGVKNIMERAKKYRITKIVYTSSVDAFRYSLIGPVDETWADFNYGGGGYNYADTKRQGDKISVRLCSKWSRCFYNKFW